MLFISNNTDIIVSTKNKSMKTLKKFESNLMINAAAIKGGDRRKKYKAKSGTLTINIYESNGE